MIQNKFPRGSEWRKWDLHVHTPASIEHNYKCKNGEDVWDSFISDLENLPKDIKVLGINDYLFVDGYKKVLSYKQEGRLPNIDLILPVIELRLAKFCGTKQFKRINFHIIFSNDIAPEVIENQFINALSSSYHLDPESGQTTWDGFLTKDNLKRLGDKIINCVPEEQKSRFGSPMKEGFNNLNLEIDAIYATLDKASSFFKGKYITAIGKTEWDELKWDESSIGEKKNIINRADIVFTAAESIEKFNFAKHKLKEQCVNDLLLDCSDAHNNIDCFSTKDRLGNCFTWIKADPTFEGLKQILIEPENRVYIGEKPKVFKTVEDNRTKYINELFIDSIDGYNGIKGKWFEKIHIPFNKELVAIIGNKGNGKSAISDILAHSCNYKNQDYFSFLNDNKFRNKNLASYYTATVQYEDGQTEKKGLSDIPDESEITRVKYLPQGYFESICNDLQKEENLKAEIESVVFQYIDEASRLGSSNFKELIKKKADAIELAIQQQKSKLSLLNKDIVALEDKGYPSYKKRIIAAIEQKEKEIEALIVPQEVPRPNLEDEESKNTINGIARVKEEIVSLNKTIKEFEDEKGSISITLSRLNDFIINADGIIRSVIDFKEENKSFVESLGGNIDEIIAVNKDFTTLEKKRAELKKRLEEIDSMISEQSQLENSPVFILKKKQVEFNELKNKLDGPSKAYQTYLQQKEEYETHKKRIEGDESIPNSLNWLKKEKRYIEDILTNDLQGKIAARNHCLKNIYNKRKEIIAIYQQVKSKLDAKIADNKSLLNNYEIRIEASLGLKNSFSDDFLRFVNQSKSGSFRGIESGQSVVQELIKNADLQSEDGIESFCNSFVEKLKMNDEKELYVQDQVEDRQSLYDYLFSLDYLTNNYSIMQGDKDLSVLSPGEKGALLLVFYLLLDMDNIPLILDQPEDNLDNDSVANILVDFIKEAKKKRQIIMVTHNPNLAVVADAEQIVYVTIDKKDGNKVSIESGSIENPNTNKHIVDVLEGAMPAFRKRDDKYIQ